MEARDIKEKADKFNPSKQEGPVAAAIEEYTASISLSRTWMASPLAGASAL